MSVPMYMGTNMAAGSSIGNGGIGTKCAENPTRKKCAKIPRSNISGIPRSNPKVKYFRNAKVNSQGQMGKNRFEPEKTGKMGKCKKNKKPKRLKEKMIM